MADFRLPMGAGPETSSVSFDPRRQVAPVGDDEVTQVTQSGGPAGPNVGATIQQQFNATERATSADGFTASGNQAPAGNSPAAANTPSAANQRDVPRDVAKMLEGKYVAKRGVWKDITKKKADQVRIRNKAFAQGVAKKKADLAQLKRRANENKSLGAQANRRRAQQQTIDSQMARRLRMQAGPERPAPAQPRPETQGPTPTSVAPGEPTGTAGTGTGRGPTSAE